MLVKIKKKDIMFICFIIVIIVYLKYINNASQVNVLILIINTSYTIQFLT